VASFTCQLYYAFFNSFSTETLFDSVNLTLYNITFTSLPIFVFALLEQERRKIILHKNSKRVQQYCGSGIRDGYLSRIPVPNVFFHAGSVSNNLSILTQKIGF
jgi:magnesium-transporting ATPase (P-type)